MNRALKTFNKNTEISLHKCGVAPTTRSNESIHKCGVAPTTPLWVCSIGTFFNRKINLGIISVFLIPLAILSGAARSEVITGADVPMRDGVLLKADIYLPEGGGPFPAVVSRTPYGRGGLKSEGEEFTKRGMALVAVDVRGRFDSGGAFTPFVNEGEDGVDTLRWIASQPWCNGKTAGFGGSYVGYTQWALTAEPVEGLTTLAPLFTTADIYNVVYRKGAFHVATGLGWASTQHDKSKVDTAAYLMSIRAQRKLPLTEADNMTGYQLDFYDEWLAHPEHDDFWDRANHAKNFGAKNIPVLMAAGWFDLFIGPQLEDFSRMITEGPADTAGRSTIIVGPWEHSGGLISNIISLPENAKHANLFKPAMYDWYEYQLLGRDNAAAALPRVKLFVMGADRWQDFDTWPPPTTQYTPWYFHSDGAASDPAAPGAVLSPAAPGDETPDSYDYSPKDPTPSRGGAILAADMGPYDYSEIEQRPDVLSYTSAPLDAPLEIIGPVTAKIYASTTACGTDFVARLLDVTPDGVAIPLVEGIVRSQALPGGPPAPDETRLFDIDLWPTAYQFKSGHRIRVDVASAAFPHWDRNLNVCGEPFGMTKKMRPARQTVYHDPARPSHIILPVHN